MFLATTKVYGSSRALRSVRRSVSSRAFQWESVRIIGDIQDQIFVTSELGDSVTTDSVTESAVEALNQAGVTASTLPPEVIFGGLGVGTL
jgi:hypothetical protein